jgi:hypothetical protein
MTSGHETLACYKMLHMALDLERFFVMNKYGLRMRSEVMRFGTVQRQALVNTSMYYLFCS